MNMSIDASTVGNSQYSMIIGSTMTMLKSAENFTANVLSGPLNDSCKSMMVPKAAEVESYTVNAILMRLAELGIDVGLYMGMDGLANFGRVPQMMQQPMMYNPPMMFQQPMMMQQPQMYQQPMMQQPMMQQQQMMQQPMQMPAAPPPMMDAPATPPPAAAPPPPPPPAATPPPAAAPAPAKPVEAAKPATPAPAPSGDVGGGLPGMGIGAAPAGEGPAYLLKVINGEI